MSEDVIFKRKLRDIGNVLGTSLPTELLEFLELKKNDQLLMTARLGKSGKGICIWKGGQDDEGTPE
jgi:hypothetical protein